MAKSSIEVPNRTDRSMIGYDASDNVNAGLLMMIARGLLECLLELLRRLRRNPSRQRKHRMINTDEPIDIKMPYSNDTIMCRINSTSSRRYKFSRAVLAVMPACFSSTREWLAESLSIFSFKSIICLSKCSIISISCDCSFYCACILQIYKILILLPEADLSQFGIVNLFHSSIDQKYFGWLLQNVLQQ